MSYQDLPLMLSQAPFGQGVLIGSIDFGSPTLIHTATSDSATTDILELTVSNLHTADVLLTLLWGDATDPNSAIMVLVEHQKGQRQLTLPQPIRNGLTVSAYASVTNVLRVWQAGGTCQLQTVGG